MKRVLIATLVFVFSENVLSQNLAMEESSEEWSEGTINLTNGTILKGLLRYNDKTGILRYENGGTSKSLTARNVISYSYTEAASNKLRLFYSIEYEDSKSGAKRPLFFEFIKEYSQFAVLSKIDPIDIDQIQNPYGYYYPYGATTNTQVSQSETIYFLKQEGEITPVLKITNKEIDSSLGIGLLFMIPYKSKTTKRKLEGKNILESYTEPYYEDLKKYAKENDLTFKKKEDFLKILDYYETLVAEN